MAFKDILLTLTSYPDPTPASVAEQAAAIAATFGAHLAAVTVEVGHPFDCNLRSSGQAVATVENHRHDHDS